MRIVWIDVHILKSHSWKQCSGVYRTGWQVQWPWGKLPISPSGLCLTAKSLVRSSWSWLSFCFTEMLGFPLINFFYSSYNLYSKLLRGLFVRTPCPWRTEQRPAFGIIAPKGPFHKCHVAKIIFFPQRREHKPYFSFLDICRPCQV